MKSVFRSLKVQKSLLWSVKILVFVFIVYHFVTRLSAITSDHISEVKLDNSVYFLFAAFLLLLNWGLELLKWYLTVSTIGASVAIRKLIPSLLAGIATGIVTPNRLGNFIGRVVYYEYKDRALLTLGTLYGNLSQFLATVFFGVIGWVYSSNSSWEIGGREWLQYAVAALTLFAIVLYFLFPFVSIIRIKWLNRRMNTLMVFQKSARKLVFVLFVLSGVRYLVFILQFTLLLIAFGAQYSHELIYSLYILYLASTLTPNLVMGKLIVRETLGLIILAEVIGNPVIILAASLSLWGINLGLPALIGLFFFKRPKETTT